MVTSEMCKVKIRSFKTVIIIIIIFVVVVVVFKAAY